MRSGRETDNQSPKVKQRPTTATIAIALGAGSVEHVATHWLSTAGVRLQMLKGKQKSVFNYQTYTILKGNSFWDLLDGFWAGAFDKAVKRAFKFTFQDWFNKLLKATWAKQLEERYGKKFSETALNTFSGSVGGILEALFFLPLDYRKVAIQYDKRAINMSYYDIYVNRAGYAGLGPTCWRNGLGSALLFGGSSAVYTYGFNLDNPKDQATKLQNFLASIIGSWTSAVLTIPFDVVKTRMQVAQAQAEPHTKLESSLSFVKKIAKEEGIGALMKAWDGKGFNAAVKLGTTFFIFKEGLNWYDKKYGYGEVEGSKLKLNKN